MPFPVQHQYVNVIGDAYGAVEKWQFGFRITDGGVSNEVTALAIAAHVEDWWTSTGVFVAPNTFESANSHRLTELKVSRIQPDGLQPPDSPSYSHFYLPAITGTSVPPSGTLPQATVACTLFTAVPRGLASKGRLYLPPSFRYGIVPGDGLMTVANAQALANSVWLLLQAINNTEVVGNVAVFSRGRGVPAYDAEHNRIEYTYPNPGAQNNVTGVRVGRVIDTQRRRRRQLVEGYITDSV